MHGHTVASTYDALLDHLSEARAQCRRAHAELVALAVEQPQITENPHYRAARLALVPTPKKQDTPEGSTP
jgi:hypothetical protein